MPSSNAKANANRKRPESIRAALRRMRLGLAMRAARRVSSDTGELLLALEAHFPRQPAVRVIGGPEVWMVAGRRWEIWDGGMATDL